MNILNWILFVLLNILFSATFVALSYNIILLFLVVIFLAFIFPIKLITLPLLYEKSDKNSSLFHFLDRFNNNLFAIFMVFLLLILDFTLTFLLNLKFFNYDMLSNGLVDFKTFLLMAYLYSQGGLFFAYLTFFVWLKIRKSKWKDLILSKLNESKYITFRNIAILLFVFAIYQCFSNQFLGNSFSFKNLFLFIPPIILIYFEYTKTHKKTIANSVKGFLWITFWTLVFNYWLL